MFDDPKGSTEGGPTLPALANKRKAFVDGIQETNKNDNEDSFGGQAGGQKKDTAAGKSLIKKRRNAKRDSKLEILLK